jgi:hypothetical protein
MMISLLWAIAQDLVMHYGPKQKTSYPRTELHTKSFKRLPHSFSIIKTNMQPSSEIVVLRETHNVLYIRQTQFSTNEKVSSMTLQDVKCPHLRAQPLSNPRSLTPQNWVETLAVTF